MLYRILRFMRLEKGLTQKDVADKLNLSPCAVAHYESGSRSITLENLIKYAEVCNFEILFFNKSNHKSYKVYDVLRIDYDTRITDKKKKEKVNI